MHIYKLIKFILINRAGKSTEKLYLSKIIDKLLFKIEVLSQKEFTKAEDLLFFFLCTQVLKKVTINHNHIISIHLYL